MLQLMYAIAYIEVVAGSIKRIVNALDRLMLNMGEPGYAKRKLFMSAAMSKLTHSASV